MFKVKSSLLWRILLVVTCAVFLSALLTVFIFSGIGRKNFSRVMTNELVPKAHYIAEITRRYFEHDLDGNEYYRRLGGDENIWEVSVYAFGADEDIVAYTAGDDNEHNHDTLKAYFNDVFAGKEVFDNDDMMVGVPVISSENKVIGAVFLIKPMNELYTNLYSFTGAFFVSVALVIVTMLLPSYFASRSITKPIRKMTEIASGIANGDFTLKAPEKGCVEVTMMGRSLNHLSNTLSNTIFDLTYERNRLQSIVNSMTEGIIAIDDEGVISNYNLAAIRLLEGCCNSIDKDCETVKRIFEAADKLKARVSDDGASDVPGIVFNAKISESTLRVSVSAVLDEDGNYKGVVAVLGDVTEEARFEQARRDYVANVSHELRTPIASIRGLADAMNDGLVKDDAVKQRYYGYILSESNRLSRLIDDLLELSRLQSGSIAFHRMSTDVVETVMYVADRFHDMAENSNRSIDIGIEDDLPFAWTNPDRAEQILVVLIDNAISHADEGSSIEVSARRMCDEDCRDLEQALGVEIPDGHASRKMIVQVKNSGVIDQADIRHLFDRFYKVDKSHSSGGTGLGLAIAKEVMDILGENIWIVSRDGHVCFSFTLEIFNESIHSDRED